MARLRYNGLTTTLGASLTSSATSVTFGAALTHSGGTAVPTLAGTDYIPLTIMTSGGAVSEIVYLTAYTSGATTGTITRGQEGTTGVAHSSGDKVVHGPTVADTSRRFATTRYNSGTTTITATSMAPVNNSTAGNVKVQIAAAVGDLLEVGVNLQAGDSVANFVDLNVATYVSGVETNRVGGTGANGSISAWTIRPSDFWGVSGNAFYTVVAGDIVAGIVELRLLAKHGAGSDRAILTTTAAPLDIWVKNQGPQ